MVKKIVTLARHQWDTTSSPTLARRRACHPYVSCHHQKSMGRRRTSTKMRTMSPISVCMSVVDYPCMTEIWYSCHSCACHSIRSLLWGLRFIKSAPPCNSAFSLDIPRSIESTRSISSCGRHQPVTVPLILGSKSCSVGILQAHPCASTSAVDTPGNSARPQNAEPSSFALQLVVPPNKKETQLKAYLVA
jgi:hypothetical protein